MAQGINWIIVKWCKAITDDGKDWYINQGKKTKEMKYKFRLLDDDGEVYGYGWSDDDSNFDPLDRYMPAYGVTDIQYKNPETGAYESL